MKFRVYIVPLMFAMMGAGSQAAHAACNNASVKGVYGITSVGLNLI